MKNDKEFCPLCGSELVVIEYRGHDPEVLALMKSDGFCGFLGCCRVDLHDRVVDDVNYRGKVFFRRVSHAF
jgi:hypothetical protein